MPPPVSETNWSISAAKVDGVEGGDQLDRAALQRTATSCGHAALGVQLWCKSKTGKAEYVPEGGDGPLEIADSPVR